MAALRLPCSTGRLSIILLLSIVLAAGCGGGGAGPSTSSGVVGPAAIEISLNTGTGTSPLAAGTLAASAAEGFRPVTDLDEFEHVYMEVVKIALLPAHDGAFDGGDMVGEMRGGTEPARADAEQVRSGWVTLVPRSTTVIDLVNLENGKKLADILSRFESVPAGTYNKIRVFYRNVTLILSSENGGEVKFHPTAHSHFDLHFLNGKELVIPVATDTTYPDSWVKFFKVQLDVEGLMIRIVEQGKDWKSAKVILRPQIFVEFVPPILYSIAGEAFNVGSANTASFGTFDIDAVGRTINAAYTGTTHWFFDDNVLADSDWTVDATEAMGSLAFLALRDRATVEAIGRFDSGLVFTAKEIWITFPDERSGVVDNGWRPDDTFVIRQAGDNVVFPKPDRSTAYYDNAVANPVSHLHEPLDNTYIDNNVNVRARGYTVFDNSVPIGIDAFWISIGP